MKGLQRGLFPAHFEKFLRFLPKHSQANTFVPFRPLWDFTTVLKTFEWFTCNVPPSGQHGLLHNSFFQHDSELNTPMISTNIFFRKDEKFLTIKLLYQKQSPSRFSNCEKKSVLKYFVKLSVRSKPMSDSDTGPFLSIL